MSADTQLLIDRLDARLDLNRFCRDLSGYERNIKDGEGCSDH